MWAEILISTRTFSQSSCQWGDLGQKDIYINMDKENKGIREYNRHGKVKIKGKDIISNRLYMSRCKYGAIEAHPRASNVSSEQNCTHPKGLAENKDGLELEVATV